MAANQQRLLNAWRYSHPCASTPVLIYGFAAILNVAVGGLGLIAPSPLRQIVESWINIHLLFGLLLCALIVARYRWCIRHSPSMTLAEIKELSRHLSRIVYLVLYGVIAFKEIIGLFSGIWHGGDDDAQVVLASGVLALFGARALAFRLWLRSTAARRNSTSR